MKENKHTPGPWTVAGESARGPWRKTSQRGYVRIEDGMKCEVGSIHAGVIRVSSCEVCGQLMPRKSPGESRYVCHRCG